MGVGDDAGKRPGRLASVPVGIRAVAIMQEDYGSRLQLGPGSEPDLVRPGPVAVPNTECPAENGIVQLMNRGPYEGIPKAMRRPENPGGTSGGSRDELVRQAQLPLDEMGALEMEFLVIHGVIAHFVRSAADEARQLGMPGHMIADQEKRSRDMVEVQYLKNPFRGGGAGSVIKGEVEVA